MEQLSDQPMEQGDFDYEKMLQAAVFKELLLESANAIDADFPGNRHESANGAPFFTASWIDSRGYSCLLRAHTSVSYATQLLEPDEWVLRTRYHFKYEMIDYEPRELMYSDMDDGVIVPLDDVIGGVGSDAPGSEVLRNADYVFACEMLRSLKDRPDRKVQTDGQRKQLELHALSVATDSPLIKEAMSEVDLYGRRASRKVVDKIIEMILAEEPIVDPVLARKWVEDEYYLRDAA